MKKLIIILCSTVTIHAISIPNHKVIALCPLQLLDETDPIHDHFVSPALPEALEQITIQDTLIILSRIMQDITLLSTQPHTAAQVGMRIAALIASVMEATSTTAAEHNLSGTDSLAQVYRCMHKRPRPDKDPENRQERQRIRDIILASCINLLTNVAVITAHPHDHKLVASQSTLIAANIINAVKETIRSSHAILTDQDYTISIEILEKIITNACAQSASDRHDY